MNRCWRRAPRRTIWSGFVRGERVATVVARFVLGLARDGGWADTTVELPPGTWTDVLGGSVVAGDGGGGPVIGAGR